MVWKTEEYFNGFLLNGGKWQGKKWNAIGIAVYGNYASAWFGETADPDGVARVCSNTPEEPVKDTLKPVPVVKKPVVTLKKTKANKGKVVKADSVSLNPEVLQAMKPADTLTIKMAEPASMNDTVPKTYYIIVKTNLSMETATKFVNSMKAKDYPDARVIAKDGKIRVSVFESPLKTVATAKLREVKKTYRDAWLYKN
jgi:hypothetical protein